MYCLKMCKLIALIINIIINFDSILILHNFYLNIYIYILRQCLVKLINWSIKLFLNYLNLFDDFTFI